MIPFFFKKRSIFVHTYICEESSWEDAQETVNGGYFLKKNYTVIQFLEVTLHLQLLQNIGYVPHVVQYILEPILYLIDCTFHSSTPILPLPPLPTGNH